jgi:hypothetical protein
VKMMIQWLFSFITRKTQAINAPLAKIKQYQRDALIGSDDIRTERVLYKIDLAKTPADLWALRSELHQCIAQTHTESVAAHRMNEMTSLFKGWIPAAKLTRVQPGFKPSQD